MLCKHGVPAFYGVVKKEGPNKGTFPLYHARQPTRERNDRLSGRAFHTCVNRENRCDFWQWLDPQNNSSQGSPPADQQLQPVDVPTLTKEDETFLRAKGIPVYVNCTLQKQHVGDRPWVRPFSISAFAA